MNAKTQFRFDLKENIFSDKATAWHLPNMRYLF